MELTSKFKKDLDTLRGAANGDFTLGSTLNAGFKAGTAASKKINNKEIDIQVPNVNEKNHKAHDKFWCSPLRRS